MLITLLNMVGTAMLTSIILLWGLRRTLPTVISDVGLSVAEQINEKLKETFESPNVQRAMSILGKKSGEVRADNALRNKAADKLLEGYPSIGFVLDQLDLTPVEGLQLLKDPLIGPFIQGIIQKGMVNLTKGANPSSPSSTSKFGWKE